MKKAESAATTTMKPCVRHQERQERQPIYELRVSDEAFRPAALQAESARLQAKFFPDSRKNGSRCVFCIMDLHQAKNEELAEIVEAYECDLNRLVSTVASERMAAEDAARRKGEEEEDPPV